MRAGVDRTAEALRHPAAALVALALALIATAAAQLRVGRDTFPLTDEIGWAVQNEGPTSGMLELWGGWFDPLARLTFNLIYATAGLDAGLSFRLLSLACNLALGLAVFWYCARRARPWTGVALVLVLGLLGPAVHTMLFPVNALNALGMAALPTGLVLLERRDRRGDIVACAVLLLAMGFAGPVAVPVCAGLALWLAVQRPFDARRLAVPGVPLAVYALAYLTLPEGGYSTEGPLGDNLAALPGWVMDAAAGSVAALAAQGPPADGAGVPTMGAGLLVLAVAAVAALWSRLDAGARARVLACGGAALAAWALVGVSRAHIGDPTTSRYVLLGVVPLLLIAVELTSVAGRSWRLGALGLAAIAVVSNALLLADFAAGIREQARIARAEFGALELVMEDVAPAPSAPGSIPLAFAPPGPWSEAVGRHGPSFALEPGRIAGRPADERAVADRVLRDLGAVSTGETAPSAPGASCTGLAGGGESVLSHRGVVVEPIGETPLSVNLRRFADAPDPERAIAVAPGAALSVDAVEDEAPVAWTLVLGGPARVCESPG